MLDLVKFLPDLYNLTVNWKPHISMISISISASAVVAAAIVLHLEVAKSSLQKSRYRPNWIPSCLPY